MHVYTILNKARKYSFVETEWPMYASVNEVIHYNNVMMDAMASQITSLSIIYSIVYSGSDQRKHQSSTSLAFVRGTHPWPVNSPHQWPVTWKIFLFDEVIIVDSDIRLSPTRYEAELPESMTSNCHLTTVKKLKWNSTKDMIYFLSKCNSKFRV